MEKKITTYDQSPHPRVPEGWEGQDKAFVIQIDNIISQIYKKIGDLNRKIGEKSEIATQTFDMTTDIPTFGAEASNSVTFNISKSGYTPIGMLTWTGNNTTGLVIQEYYISSNNFKIYLRNPTSSAKTPTKLSVKILYLKS